MTAPTASEGRTIPAPDATWTYHLTLTINATITVSDPDDPDDIATLLDERLWQTRLDGRPHLGTVTAVESECADCGSQYPGRRSGPCPQCCHQPEAPAATISNQADGQPRTVCPACSATGTVEIVMHAVQHAPVRIVDGDLLEFGDFDEVSCAVHGYRCRACHATVGRPIPAGG